MEDSVGCSPFNAHFRNGSLGFSSFQYNFGDGVVSPPGNPESTALTNHIYQTANMYEDMTFQVKLTVKRGTCEDSQTKEIQVYSRPKADFRPGQPYPADFPYPAPPIQLVNLIPEPDRAQLVYQWSWKEHFANRENHFSTGQHPTSLELEDWGSFDITQHVTAPNGLCSDSKTLTIRIVPPPPLATFEEVLPDCAPYTVEFVNNSLYGRAYKWDFGDGYTSSDKSPTHTFMEPGTYNVELIVMGDDMFPKTAVRTITVHPLPQAGFEVQSNFLWVGQTLRTLNYTKHADQHGQPYDVWYQWDFGDGSPIRSDESPTHMYSKKGVYTITLTASTHTEPQCSTTATLHNAITLEGSGEIMLPNAFKPTTTGEPSDVVPTGGYKNYLFYPPVISAVRKYSMLIYNRWGQLLYQTSDVNRGWNGYFRGRVCDEGLYMYRIEGVYETGEVFLKVGDVVVVR
jgi:gliding motility-associated-like protein